jgi:hypothetical protein
MACTRPQWPWAERNSRSPEPLLLSRKHDLGAVGMIFFHILKSLDDLLYELMTWLVFYPVTLWRSVRYPLRTMKYARVELRKRSADQFRETLRPPIFLLVTLVLAHVVELEAVGDSQLLQIHSGLADYINDDTTLIIFRIIAFALFPVLMATIETKLTNEHVNRRTLQQPFYAQCFLAAPYALALSLASTAIRYSNSSLQTGGVALVFVSSLIYVWIESRWLRESTPASGLRAIASAIGGFAACISILGGLALLLGGE